MGSKETTIRLKKQKEEARREQTLEGTTMAEKNQINPDNFFANDGLILNEVDRDTEGNIEADVPESPIAPVRIYVNRKWKYEDLKSPVSAFLVVGAISLATAVVYWSDIIPLPLSDASKVVMQSVITIIGILSIFVVGSSSKSTKTLAPQIEDENKATQKLIQWFQGDHVGGQVDNTIEGIEDLTPEELNLKRLRLIQDHPITSYDLPDQAYVGALSEETHGKSYE